MTTPEPATDLGVSNQSTFGKILWIGFYTTLLSILTLTIFRFWGRTHFRRQIWSDTMIGGEPLEYTGKGLELFIGFVIAMFVLMLPFVSIVIATQLFLGPDAIAFVFVPIYLIFFVLIGVAIFLARRYHHSRTRYRGIRFAQTGSAWGYGFATFGYGLLTTLTLGWFGPAMRVRLSRKLWKNAYFGSQPFEFNDTPEAKAEPVYLSFALAWVGGIVVYGVWAALMFTHIEGLDEAMVSGDVETIGLFYASLIPAGLLIAVFVAWHEAVMIRRIIKSLSLGELRFSSRMSTIDIIELAITNTLIVIFTLGFGYMVTQMRVWKRIANRFELAGQLDFEAIRQSEHEAPKQGEGLADGLDLVSNF